MSEAKPVYPEFHNKGARFQLYSDGSVTVRTKDIGPREAFTLKRSDTGEPWIPSHKNFNSLCRESVREGDVDDLIRGQERISKARGLKRRAGVELYASLEQIMANPNCRQEVEAQLGSEIWASLTKARGEK